MTDKRQEFFDAIELDRERLRQGGSAYRHSVSTLACIYAKKSTDPSTFLDRARTMKALTLVYPNHDLFKLEDVAKYLDIIARSVYHDKEKDFTPEMTESLNDKRASFRRHGIFTHKGESE